MHTGALAYETAPSHIATAQPACVEDALRAVVRGERRAEPNLAAHILASATHGLAPEFSGLSVSAVDLAEGICNLKHDRTALSEWASFILVTADSLRVEDAHTGYWDRLVSCVWDLAFGAPLREPALALATAVRAHPSFA